MDTKFLMVCRCQAVNSAISASVAPLARFISAMTSAFLLLRCGRGPLLAGGPRLLCSLGFLGRRLRLLPGGLGALGGFLRFGFRFARLRGGGRCFLNIDCDVRHAYLLCRQMLGGQDIHHLGAPNKQVNCAGSGWRTEIQGEHGVMTGQAPFYSPTKRSGST